MFVSFLGRQIMYTSTFKDVLLGFSEIRPTKTIAALPLHHHLKGDGEPTPTAPVPANASSPR